MGVNIVRVSDKILYKVLKRLYDALLDMVKSDPEEFIDVIRWWAELYEKRDRYGTGFTIIDDTTLSDIDFDDNGEDYERIREFNSPSEMASALKSELSWKLSEMVPGYILEYEDVPSQRLRNIIEEVRAEQDELDRAGIQRLRKELGRKLLPPGFGASRKFNREKVLASSKPIYAGEGNNMNILSDGSAQLLIDDLCTSQSVYEIMKLLSYVKSPSRYEITFDVIGFEDYIEDGMFKFNADVVCNILDRKSGTTKQKDFTISLVVDADMYGDCAVHYNGTVEPFVIEDASYILSNLRDYEYDDIDEQVHFKDDSDDAPYRVSGYLSDNFSGLVNYEEFSDPSDAEGYVWELVNKGNYVVYETDDSIRYFSPAELDRFLEENGEVYDITDAEIQR